MKYACEAWMKEWNGSGWPGIGSVALSPHVAPPSVEICGSMRLGGVATALWMRPRSCVVYAKVLLS
jgi:hypothetical protein